MPTTAFAPDLPVEVAAVLAAVLTTVVAPVPVVVVVSLVDDVELADVETFAGPLGAVVEPVDPETAPEAGAS